jgi:hypothetical protein
MKVGFFFEINGMPEIRFQPGIPAQRRTKVPVFKKSNTTAQLCSARASVAALRNRSNSFGHRWKTRCALDGIPDQQWKERAAW